MSTVRHRVCGHLQNVKGGGKPYRLADGQVCQVCGLPLRRDTVDLMDPPKQPAKKPQKAAK